MSKSWFSNKPQDPNPNQTNAAAQKFGEPSDVSATMPAPISDVTLVVRSLDELEKFEALKWQAGKQARGWEEPISRSLHFANLVRMFMESTDPIALFKEYPSAGLSVFAHSLTSGTSHQRDEFAVIARMIDRNSDLLAQRVHYIVSKGETSSEMEAVQSMTFRKISASQYSDPQGWGYFMLRMQTLTKEEKKAKHEALTNGLTGCSMSGSAEQAITHSIEALKDLSDGKAIIGVQKFVCVSDVVTRAQFAKELLKESIALSSATPQANRIDSALSLVLDTLKGVFVPSNSSRARLTSVFSPEEILKRVKAGQIQPDDAMQVLYLMQNTFGYPFGVKGTRLGLAVEKCVLPSLSPQGKSIFESLFSERLNTDQESQDTFRGRAPKNWFSRYENRVHFGDISVKKLEAQIAAIHALTGGEDATQYVQSRDSQLLERTKIISDLENIDVAELSDVKALLEGAVVLESMTSVRFPVPSIFVAAIQKVYLLRLLEEVNPDRNWKSLIARPLGLDSASNEAVGYLLRYGKVLEEEVGKKFTYEEFFYLGLFAKNILDVDMEASHSMVVAFAKDNKSSLVSSCQAELKRFERIPQRYVKLAWRLSRALADYQTPEKTKNISNCLDALLRKEAFSGETLIAITQCPKVLTNSHADDVLNSVVRITSRVGAVDEVMTSVILPLAELTIGDDRNGKFLAAFLEQLERDFCHYSTDRMSTCISTCLIPLMRELKARNQAMTVEQAQQMTKFALGLGRESEEIFSKYAIIIAQNSLTPTTVIEILKVLSDVPTQSAHALAALFAVGCHSEELSNEKIQSLTKVVTGFVSGHPKPHEYIWDVLIPMATKVSLSEMDTMLTASSVKRKGVTKSREALNEGLMPLLLGDNSERIKQNSAALFEILLMASDRTNLTESRTLVRQLIEKDAGFIDWNQVDEILRKLPDDQRRLNTLAFMVRLNNEGHSDILQKTVAINEHTSELSKNDSNSFMLEVGKILSLVPRTISVDQLTILGDHAAKIERGREDIFSLYRLLGLRDVESTCSVLKLTGTAQEVYPIRQTSLVEGLWIPLLSYFEKKVSVDELNQTADEVLERLNKITLPLDSLVLHVVKPLLEKEKSLTVDKIREYLEAIENECHKKERSPEEIGASLVGLGF